MGIKLELTVSRAETIQPKEDEVIYSINWDNGKYDYDSSIYPVTVSIGKIITFETENPVIIDFINWENAVAFEVYEGDKLVYVANKPSFNVKNAITSNTKVYAIAYDGTKIEVKL